MTTAIISRFEGEKEFKLPPPILDATHNTLFGKASAGAFGMSLLRTPYHSVKPPSSSPTTRLKLTTNHQNNYNNRLMWRPKTGWRQEFESGDAQIPLALQLPNTCTLYQSSDRHYHPKKRKGDGKHRCMFKSSWFVASKQIAELHGNHIVQCSSKQDFVILNIEHPSVVKLLARRALDWNDADSFSPITVKEDGVSHERVIRHTSFIENKSLTTAITRYMRHPENIQLFIKELKLKGAHTIHGIGNVRPMMACEPPSKREHARIVKGSPIPTSNLQHQTSMGPVPLSTVMQFSEILLFSPNQVVDTKSAKSYANTSPDALAHAQRRACARTNVQRQRQMALAKHQHMRRVRAQRKRQTATIRRRTQTLPLII